MDFSNSGFSRIEGAYRNFQDPNRNQRTLMIEVVVIDLTSPDKSVYQLNQDSSFTEEELKLIKQGVISIPTDAFVPIGEVESINKKSKMITLTNQNVVAYNHLITVTGKQPTLLSYEFLAGLYALVDALRVNKLSESFATLDTTQLDLKINVSQNETTHNEKIEKLGNYALPTKRPEQATVLVSELNKKLFQVQI